MLLIEIDEKEYNSLEVELRNSGISYEVVHNDGIDADSIVQIVVGASSAITAGAVKILLELIRARSKASVKIGGMEFKGYSKEDIIKISNEFESAKRKQEKK